jgi:hypothetical protein
MAIVLYDMNSPMNSINEQLIEKNFALPDTNYYESIRLANDALNDIHGYKTQRIRQYIESQRTFTTQSTDKISTSPTNVINNRHEHKCQTQKAITSIEPLPLSDEEGRQLKRTNTRD